MYMQSCTHLIEILSKFMNNSLMFALIEIKETDFHLLDFRCRNKIKIDFFIT